MKVAEQQKGSIRLLNAKINYFLSISYDHHIFKSIEENTIIIVYYNIVFSILNESNHLSLTI